MMTMALPETRPPQAYNYLLAHGFMPDAKELLQRGWSPFQSDNHAMDVVDRLMANGYQMSMAANPQLTWFTAVFERGGQRHAGKGMRKGTAISRAAVAVLAYEEGWIHES